MNEDLLPTKVTIDQGNLIRKVMRSWNEDLLNVDHLMPPKLSPILRKSSDMQNLIQRVKFTEAIARHTKIRDQNPSLRYICPGEPHQRSPNAPKFEDRSQEETVWQEQGEAAWKLAKSVLKLKEHERATFFSPSENRCLPASNLKPEEREFVVDSVRQCI